MRKSTVEDSLGHAVSEAYCEILVLAEEMSDAFENTPEQFQENSGRGRRIAAEMLSAVCEPEVPQSIKDQVVSWMEYGKGRGGNLSRRERRDNQLRCLQSCLVRISALPNDDQLISDLRAGLMRDVRMLEDVVFPGQSGR